MGGKYHLILIVKELYPDSTPQEILHGDQDKYETGTDCGQYSSPIPENMVTFT